MPAAANRLTGLVDQYPLFSMADEALWMLGDSYDRMGDRFEDKSATAYTRLVKDYPLSPHAEAAKKKLEAMKQPVPAADPVALARMKYELVNRNAPSKMNRLLDNFKRNPDTRLAAKGGTPTMTVLRPGIPVSVPVQPGAATPGATGGVGSDVTIGVTNDTKELDQRPDARATPPAAGATAPAAPAAPATDQAAKPADGGLVALQQPFATNHPITEKDRKLAMKKMQEKAKLDKKAAAKAAKHAPAQPAQPAQPQTTPPAPAAQPAQTPPQE
jgi:outer membrane protein assembly factor BamD